ncbi:helix-turn-helix domain-containing protein [Actinomadura darangshiensis]
MLSVEEVADRLGLHVRTVRGYIRGGRLRRCGSASSTGSRAPTWTR